MDCRRCRALSLTALRSTPSPGTQLPSPRRGRNACPVPQVRQRSTPVLPALPAAALISAVLATFDGSASAWGTAGWKHATSPAECTVRDISSGSTAFACHTTLSLAIVWGGRSCSSFQSHLLPVIDSSACGEEPDHIGGEATARSVVNLRRGGEGVRHHFERRGRLFHGRSLRSDATLVHSRGRNALARNVACIGQAGARYLREACPGAHQTHCGQIPARPATTRR